MHYEISALFIVKIVSEYDQEIPQSQTANNPVAPSEHPSNLALFFPQTVHSWKKSEVCSSFHVYTRVFCIQFEYS